MYKVKDLQAKQAVDRLSGAGCFLVLVLWEDSSTVVIFYP
jgi:hypothetical protein